MSGFFNDRYIKNSKKDHYCIACGTKSIKAGDPHYYFVSKYETEFDYYRLCEKCGDHVQTCNSCREAWEDSGDLTNIQECMEHIHERNRKVSVADMYMGNWDYNNDVSLDRLVKDNPHLKYQIEQADANLTHEIKDKLNALILHNVRTTIGLNILKNMIIITKEGQAEHGGRYWAQYIISLKTTQPPSMPKDLTTYRGAVV